MKPIHRGCVMAGLRRLVRVCNERSRQIVRRHVHVNRLREPDFNVIDTMNAFNNETLQGQLGTSVKLIDAKRAIALTMIKRRHSPIDGSEWEGVRAELARISDTTGSAADLPCCAPDIHRSGFVCVADEPERIRNRGQSPENSVATLRPSVLLTCARMTRAWLASTARGTFALRVIRIVLQQKIDLPVIIRRAKAKSPIQPQGGVAALDVHGHRSTERLRSGNYLFEQKLPQALTTEYGSQSDIDDPGFSGPIVNKQAACRLRADFHDVEALAAVVPGVVCQLRPELLFQKGLDLLWRKRHVPQFLLARGAVQGFHEGNVGVGIATQTGVGCPARWHE